MKTRKASGTNAKGNFSSLPDDQKNVPGNAPNTSPTDNLEEREKTPRVSFFVDTSGSPDWERMLPKTKEQLADILRNPNVQKELGITPEEAKQVAEAAFGDDEANALLDLIGGINGVAASKIYGIPHEITSKAFTFTPEHRKKANPPITRVINKWAPLFLKTWKDEIGAAIILFAILNSQVRVMHMLEEQRRKNSPARPQAPAPAPVTPIFKPEQAAPENSVAEEPQKKDTGD